jgi:hypothetical protein
MRNNDPAAGEHRRILCQPARDELVGEAVEAVAPDTSRLQLPRQRNQAGHQRERVVEGSIEAHDLRQCRACRSHRMDRRDVVRHVQRIERGQRVEVREQGTGHFGRRYVVGATVHDAMANRR